MSNNQQGIRVSEITTSQGVQINTTNLTQAISATNNQAMFYAEQAKKYKDEAKQMKELAQYYAEQNSDVTVEYIDNIKSDLELKIAAKQNSGNYALASQIPTKISDLTDDTSTNSIDKADTLTNLTASVTELNYCDGVTSNIQTQLDGKVSKSGDTMTGNLIVSSTAPQIREKDTNFDYSATTAPSATFEYGTLRYYDQNDHIVGDLFGNFDTSNRMKMVIQASRSVNGTRVSNPFWIGIDSSGNKIYSHPQILTDYVSGASGYRIWSDGYCEQWGSTTISTSGSVSLTKTYLSKQYNVTANDASTGTSSGSFPVGIVKNAANRFTLYTTSTSVVINWVTRGYLASGQY